MAKFLTGEDLENAICEVIHSAKESLIIVSPYIKLDEYFKNVFLSKMKDHKLHLLLIFGKNENEYGKSLSINDFEFFKAFPNVTIIFSKNLHGKYYGNEKMGILTSINLYDYSFKNNVEFGVYSEISILDRFKPSYDNDVFNYCYTLAENNPSIYIKRPIVEKKLLGLAANYHGSEVLLDCTVELINNRKFKDQFIQNYPSFLEYNDHINNPIKTRKEFEKENKKLVENPILLNRNFNDFEEFGFCIRTGEKIPFNPEKPFSYSAYLSWAYYENIDFEENYCHFSGEPSNGKTSMAKPILRKNWIKAQKFINRIY
ncbi:phospholipase D-like domain-containing protein [Algoriphagus pacificus]|uniref:Phospholipase D-like domain-containing protein n=1 Tax=Algoriphagus pacificus TaxID=2811234 RepID=A0ABS3CHT0_9BACT|nr:hypothetical protein [Algoriphagus pacificus]MBN7816651.1 hypothetical protein [Algoriphagus pacificus]